MVSPRTLAEFRLATPPPPDSILGLFEETAPPATATPSDVALLKQLYAISLDREAKAHRRLLAKALRKAATELEAKWAASLPQGRDGAAALAEFRQMTGVAQQ